MKDSPFLATQAELVSEATVLGRTAVTEARPETIDDTEMLATFGRTTITRAQPETTDDEIP